MKKPSQINRRDSSAACVAQRKAPTRRVKVRVSREGKTAIEKAARERGVTKSQFAESAIREELARVSAAGKGRGAKPRRPLDRVLCKTLGIVESICRHGEPQIVKVMTNFLDRMAAEIRAARSQAKGGAN